MYPTFFLKDLTRENKEVSLAALYCLVFYSNGIAINPGKSALEVGIFLEHVRTKQLV